MNKLILLALWCFAAILPAAAQKKATPKNSDYVVLASRQTAGDAAWREVIDELCKKHDAAVLIYEKEPSETLQELRAANPRYVAVVETPENLNRDFVISMHKFSRTIDQDIYADFLWGIITGYDAAQAMKMVRNSSERLVIHDAVATITELQSARWFDRYGWVDDHSAGLWGEKKGPKENVMTGRIPKEQVLRKFSDLYTAYNPDLVVTAAHATETNLEMPFSLGNIKSRDGVLYAEDRFTKEEWTLGQSGKRKVYFAVGNCLIGNVNNTKESMAIAWMKSGDAATMIGYVVTTWHGRNGWGGLKYWLTTPGRYTLAEAVFLNQQDFLHQQSLWNPVFVQEDFPHGSVDDSRYTANSQLTKALGKNPTKDQLGFWHDRDVLAYYGDPKWEVRLQQIGQETDFDVTTKRSGKKVTVTVKTKPGFSAARMAGNGFKKEHVLDLPFSYFFPERLGNPRLAAGQTWKTAVDENFLLVYDPNFEPGKTYKIVLETD